MRTFAAAFGFQLTTMRRSIGDFQPLITAPFFTVIFLAITEHAGRTDLAPYAVLAPTLIALWGMALNVAGELIDSERWSGTLEALIATPSSFASIITGRIAAVTTISLLAFVESWLVAWAVFGITVPIEHPLEFGTTLAATAFAMAGTASMMSAVFVLARSARIFQNSLSYPFYVLGGVLVPVALLPGWLEPLSRVVFLSWSADLMRDSLTVGSVPAAALRLLAILGLGMLGQLTGVLLLRRVLVRVRTLGTLTYA